jgi:hypothetical protein
MKNILNLLALIFILILTNIKISFSQSNILSRSIPMKEK